MRIKLLLCLLIMALVSGCESKGNRQKEIDMAYFASTHLSEERIPFDQAVIQRLVRSGDKSIPDLMELVGKAAAPGRKVKKNDYSIILILTRIGSSKAVKSLITILQHDYPGDVAEDRQIAARALVALGAKGAVSPLKKAIQAHRQWVDEQVAKGGLQESEGKQQIQNLEKALENLQAGTGKLTNPKDFT